MNSADISPEATLKHKNGPSTSALGIANNSREKTDMTSTRGWAVIVSRIESRKRSQQRKTKT